MLKRMLEIRRSQLLTEIQTGLAFLTNLAAAIKILHVRPLVTKTSLLGTYPYK